MKKLNQLMDGSALIPPLAIRLKHTMMKIGQLEIDNKVPKHTAAVGVELSRGDFLLIAIIRQVKILES